MHLIDLDVLGVRQHMLSELENSINDGSLYDSDNLSASGKAEYYDLFRTAVTFGTTVTFAEALGRPGILRSHTSRQNKDGTYRKVSSMANITLAENEYNRIYARGVCCVALRHGTGTVVVYRARQSSSPRPESQEKIGHTFAANELLIDLRANTIETVLKIPGGPNSGISLRLA